MRVEVEIDLYDVLRDLDTEDLERELDRRRKKGARGIARSDVDRLVEELDRQDMEVALWHWRCHRSHDAIYYLEKALGKPFAGLSDILARSAA